ncbi:MAG: LysR family transcriptional regulator [Pseudomonadota bacterium]
MEKPDYLDIDGYQLQLLLAIYEAGSLSAAGKTLDLNQSTVSYWLDQLRKRFDDPLFVRSGKGVKPTKRAESLVPLAKEVLRKLQTMTEKDSYDPTKDTRTLRVAATMFEREVVLKDFVDSVISFAPNLRVEFFPTGSPSKAAEELRDGAVDFTLLPEEGFEGEGLMQRILFRFQNAVYFDPAYPMQDCDIDEYCKRPHVRVVLGSETGFEIDKTLLKAGRSRHIALQVPDFDSALRHIWGTPLIATLPAHLSSYAGKGLGTCRSPWPDREYKLMLYWHERNQHSARHIYWRGQFKKAAAKYENTLELGASK